MSAQDKSLVRGQRFDTNPNLTLPDRFGRLGVFEALEEDTPLPSARECRRLADRTAGISWAALLPNVLEAYPQFGAQTVEYGSTFSLLLGVPPTRKRWAKS